MTPVNTKVIQNIDKLEIVEKLEEFNKFAEELFGLSFVDKLKGSGYSIDFKRGGPVKIESRFPDDEAIKAFINDIRRFFQEGKDTLRIYKLMPIYMSELINESEKEVFNQVMSDLEKFKQKPTNIIIYEENITNEKVWEVFLYGRFSHRSNGTKDIHDKWEGTPLYIPLKNQFITVLDTYHCFIDNIVYANNQILKRLGSNG